MIWWLILYVSIPTAVLLLAIIHFCQGFLQRINNVAMLLVGRLIFGRFKVLPFPLIQGMLGLHVLAALVLGTQVHKHHQNPPPVDLGPHWVRFHQNSWRQQRNFYLLCLSLVLWWMLYSVYSLKLQLDKAKIAFKEQLAKVK